MTEVGSTTAARAGHGRSTLAFALALALALSALFLLAAPSAWARPGELDWAVRYKGTGSDDVKFSALVVNSGGYAYAVGHAPISRASGVDAVVAKYDLSGSRRWLATYNGPSGGWDGFFATALDAKGNVFAAGQSRVKGKNASAIVTVKFAPNGSRRWVRRYQYRASGADRAVAVAADGAGNCYVVGVTYVTADELAWTIIRYNADGFRRWVARWTVFPGGAAPTDMAVDGNGNLYITGWATFGGGADARAVTSKYTSRGARLWTKYYTVEGSDRTKASAITFKNGSAYVVGAGVLPAPSESEGFIVRYSAGGRQIYESGWSSLTGGGDSFRDVTADGNGNAYVVGRFAADQANEDGLVVKFDDAGEVLWANKVDASASDSLTAVARDDGGHVVVTGQSGDVLPVAKFGPAGDSVWQVTYDGAADATDDGVAIRAYRDKAVYVAGWGTLGSGNGVALLLKYKP